ncbi:MAG TPA: hypothetical protein PKU96_01050 [bacterium]|nr:hypothetical protein [bacterium]HQC50969.1 hypothetical protein [bacterium]HQG13227.1 hypothetical protein [bacterium]
MPTIREFLEGFGLPEITLFLLTTVVIVMAREGKRIFRRKRQ